MPEPVARGSATRNANMALRRKRILDTARDIIADSGFEALSIRELARRADLSVPTIYNLIGNKSALIARLFEETISPFEHLRYITNDDDPAGGPERFYVALIASLGEKENYHRAEFLAREHLREAGDAMAISIHARGVRIAIEACEQARDAGMLRGSLSSHQLGEQIDHLVRHAFQDWAHGSIDLGALHRRLLVGTYLCLAADATDAYHPLFVAKIQSHDTAAGVVHLNHE
ncbi:MAG: TetR/AcrR family transcriptional regulator [Gammaproteobacteria bacterium]